jgi:peptidoglycan/LPS O-acetylase OafA/YrhL
LRLGYRPALDGIRAVAISLVVLGHVAFFLAPAWNGHVIRSGFLGVDLFFVLSGFLITTLLIERHNRERHPIGTFWERRALRLIPALIVLLAVNLAVAVIFNGSVGNALRSIAVTFTYTTNWAELGDIQISKYVLHFWSLAIEGQFYLVWPLVLFGLLRLGASLRQVIVVIAGLVVVVIAWRAVLWHGGLEWLRLYLRTDARADSLLVGAALALLPYDEIGARIRPATRSLLGFAGLAAVCLCAQVLHPWSDFLYYGGFTVLAFVAAVVTLVALQPGSAVYAVLAWTPLVLLGRISYSLYLWHLPVFIVMADNTDSWPVPARVVVGVGTALLLATASYVFVERPALRLKSRLGRRRSARPGEKASLSTATAASTTSTGSAASR